MGKERGPDPTASRKETVSSYMPLLQIRIDSPDDIYEAYIDLQNLTWEHFLDSAHFEMTTGVEAENDGAEPSEVIGEICSSDTDNPIKHVESSIQGALHYEDVKEDPNNPNQVLGEGEKSRSFQIDTDVELVTKRTFDDEKLSRLKYWLKCLGYKSSVEDVSAVMIRMFKRIKPLEVVPPDVMDRLIEKHKEKREKALSIVTPEGFKFRLCWQISEECKGCMTEDEAQKLNGSNTDSEVEGGREFCPTTRSVTYPDNEYFYKFMLKLWPIRMDGPDLSKQKLVEFLDEGRKVTEAVATGLSVVLGEDDFSPDPLYMEWLSPERVTGEEERVVKVQRVEGLDRLLGLHSNTVVGIEKVREMLEYPDKVSFLRDHGFKQSNGAVFWGFPGTGKTLACKALAEEIGCKREVFKLDEYLSSYIHKSAKQIGERLRQIKSEAANSQEPIIVQIDEADTILRSTGNIESDGFRPDAEEIRAVLLREFEEPGNVFYILTTNLDPRDPNKTDSAILRHQRIGLFVPFSLPDSKGRQEIFGGLMARRRSDFLRWVDVDLNLLSEITGDFTPADIEEVLTTAVSMAYDSDSKTAFVENEHFKRAVRQVEAQKVYLLSLPPLARNT